MATFSERMGQLKHDTFVTLGISVGIRLRLFDAMGALDRACTAEELAEKTGCKERYIRQWLGFMACSDIINLDNDIAGEETFSLPKERVSYLTTSTGDSSTMWMYGLPIFSTVQYQLEGCFKKDGPNGLAHECYGELNEFLDIHGRAGYVDNLIDNTLKDLPEITRMIEQGISVFEIGCGTGFLLQTMAKRFPKSDFLGVDIAAHAINSASKEAKENQIPNVRFEVHDAHALPEDWVGKFDYVFITDVIHDVPNPKKMLQEVKRVLKAGGTASVQDFPLRRKVSDNLNSPCANTGYFAGMFYCIPACMYYGGPGYGPAWGVENWEDVMKSVGFKVKLIFESSAHFMCTK